jgi:ABC-type amino acid transport substrate-binding protein
MYGICHYPNGKNTVRLLLFGTVFLILLLFATPESAFSKTIRVGIYQNPPKVFLDDRRNPQGIFVDIMNEIARKENREFEYIFENNNI